MFELWSAEHVHPNFSRGQFTDLGQGDLKITKQKGHATMRCFVFGTAILALSAGMVAATEPFKQGYKGSHEYYVKKHRNARKVTLQERFKINRSRGQLAAERQRIYRDGLVTQQEQIDLRNSELRHRSVLDKARRE